MQPEVKSTRQLILGLVSLAADVVDTLLPHGYLERTGCTFSWLGWVLPCARFPFRSHAEESLLPRFRVRSRTAFLVTPWTLRRTASRDAREKEG